MHVLAGINYNHQAPDKAAKLARRFSCLKRRVAPTPPALAHSTYETAGRSPASSNRESTQHTIPRGVHSCSRPSTSWLPRLTSISSTSSPTPSTWSRPTATERIPAPPEFHASPQTHLGCGFFAYPHGQAAPLPHVALGQRIGEGSYHGRWAGPWSPWAAIVDVFQRAPRGPPALPGRGAGGRDTDMGGKCITKPVENV